MHTKLILVAVLPMMVTLSTAAQADPPTALGGYCPVCLVKMDKLVKGDPAYSSTFDGRTYLFPGREQKEQFDKNPAAFVPALRGDCAVCKVELGKNVPGKPEFHAVHKGRLYLFPGRKQLDMFRDNPDKYTDAELALSGNCPVCMVKLGKVVKGKEEYASIYDGRRYLFPGAEQKRMFDQNPTAFVPALGGDCTVCKVEMGREVAGSAEFHAVHEGRLYLFPGEKQRTMFNANPTKYADADLALNGDCPVCKIELGKDIPGREDFAVDYRGKRYLFPGQKQRETFLQHPDKYAVTD